MDQVQNKNQINPLFIGPPVKVKPQDPEGFLAKGILMRVDSEAGIAYPLPVKKEDPISGDISVLPTNPVPSPIPGPKSREEKIILEHINYAKMLAKGANAFHAPSKEQLYAALEKITGEKITDAKKAAVEKFLDAIANDKPADVDGTGPTGIKDITIVWKTGSFFPVAWNPVEHGESNPPDCPMPPKNDFPPDCIFPGHPTKPPVGVEPRPTPNKPVPDPVSGNKPPIWICGDIWNHPQGGPSPNKPGEKPDYPIVY